MKNKTLDWTLIEVLGYDLGNNQIVAKRLNQSETIRVSMKDDQSRNWIGWLSDSSRPESAPKGSILALYNVEQDQNHRNTLIAGWGTTITKDISSDNILIAPFTISHRIKQFPNSDETYLDGIALDNNYAHVTKSSELREAVIEAVDGDKSPLVGQRGFMIRAVNIDDPTIGHIEAFYGRRDSSPGELFDFHWNRPPNPGYTKNRLQSNASAIHFNDYSRSNLMYEVVGFSRAIINTYGSQKQVETLSQLKNYRIPSTEDQGPRQAFSYAALVIDPNRPNQIRHHLPLPRAKVNNSLFGTIDISDEQKRYVGVIRSNGIQGQFQNRMQLDKSHVSAPLEITDFVNKSGKVQSFRVYSSTGRVNEHASRIENAIVGVKPFRVDNGKAFSFPIEFKEELKAQLSDLLGTCPLYIRQATINNDERLLIAGRINDPSLKSSIDRIASSVPNTVDDTGRCSFDIASFNQLATALENIAPATNPPQQESLIQNKTSPQSQKQSASRKISFADWLELKFMGRYDAMINHLYLEIETFAADHANIDWQHASTSYSVGNGTSQGELVRGVKFVQPTKGNDSHSGSLAYAINTFEKSDPKFNNPLRWFNINFINKKIKRQGAFVFNGYDYLHESYERDNGIEISTNTQDHLKQLEEDRKRRQAEAERKWLAQIQEKANARDVWMRKYPALQNEDGSSSIFSSKQIHAAIGNIVLKQGVDPKLGRFTALRLHDIDNNFRGVQQLFETSWQDEKGNRDNKLFAFGTQFKDDETENSFGTHCVIGQINPGNPIYFVEGFSTGVSIFEPSGVATVVSLNAGNLPEVVAAYRSRYPAAHLIIVADNDQWKPLKGNPGVLSAVKASYESRAHFVIPEFNAENAKIAPTDANDMRVLYGVDALRNQLREINDPVPDVHSLNRYIIEHCGLEALSKELDGILDLSDEITRPALLRSMLHSAVQSYGREKVLEYLAPEYQEYVTFDSPKKQKTSEMARSAHLGAHKVEVFEAISPSKKKYCLIKDNEGGKNAQAIQFALEKVIGKSALSFNERLGGWVAPYPTINIIKTYLFDLTGAPRMYIGQGRKTTSGDRFVVRGDFEDDGFKQEISSRIAFANPKYLKSEFGLVVENIGLTDKVKVALREYLTNNPIDVISPDKNIDPAEERISTLLAKANALSGLPVSSIVQATHRLCSGISPVIFRDDDYIFAALYQLSATSVNDSTSETHHTLALNDAAQMYITMDRQGLVDSHLSREVKRRCKALAIQVKAIHADKQLLSNGDIGRLSGENNLSTADVLSISAGVEILTNDDKTEYWSVLTEIQELYSDLQYSALSHAADVNKKKQLEKTQPERVDELLELTRLAAADGYSLDEFQTFFLHSKGSPYNPDGSGFRSADLQSDIVYIDSNKVTGDNPPKLLTEVGLFDYYVERAATDRLESYSNYITAMVQERGHLTYESFSAYLKGKRQTVVDVPNPYLIEGEFNEELLEHDVARITLYKNHQAMYQEVGKNALRTGNDLFEEEHVTEKVANPNSVEIEVIRPFTDDTYAVVRVETSGSECFRIRGSLPDSEGENLAVDSWYSKQEDLRSFIEQVSLGHTPEATELETDVIQHITNQGTTFSLCKILSTPEIYYFSGGNIRANATISDVFLNKGDAQREYANHKREIDNSVKQSAIATASKPTLPEFISNSIKAGIAPEEFIAKLSSTFKIHGNESLLESIKSQYDILYERNQQKQEQITSKFESLQEVITKHIHGGLDYDDIHTEVIGTDGALLKDNPYWDGMSIDKRNLAKDLKDAGFKSLKSLYDSRYRLVHGHPVEIDEVPIGSPYMPSVVDENAPLDSQFSLLTETVAGYSMEHLAFDRHAFPTLSEWRHSGRSTLPIHPILAIDLDANNSAGALAEFDLTAITLLYDIHGYSSDQGKSKDDMINDVLDGWKQRSIASSMELDDLRDLSSEERQEMGLSLGMAVERNISASMIKEYLSQIETRSNGKIQDYSYVIAAIGYEKRFGSLPEYGAREIQGSILKSSDYHKAEFLREQIQSERHSAEIAVKVLTSLPFDKQSTFNADELRQLEVISSSGKDYIGKYKHFYYTEAEPIRIPRQVSHYGVYEDSIIGLPYALSGDECLNHKVTPLSGSAIDKVCEGLNGWMNRYGAVGMQDSSTNSIYVLAKSGDQFALTFHVGDELKSIETGSLSSLLNNMPLEMMNFSDRNSLCEQIGKNLSLRWAISYADIMSRLGGGFDAEKQTMENLLSIDKYKAWLDDVRTSSSQNAIHYVARQVSRKAAMMCIEGKNSKEVQGELEAFSKCLPSVTGISLSEVNEFTDETKRLVLTKELPFFGIQPGSEQDQELRLKLRDSISSNNEVLENIENDMDILMPSAGSTGGYQVGSEVFIRTKSGQSLFGVLSRNQDGEVEIKSDAITKLLDSVSRLPEISKKVVLSEDGQLRINTPEAIRAMSTTELDILCSELSVFDLRAVCKAIGSDACKSKSECKEEILNKYMNHQETISNEVASTLCSKVMFCAIAANELGDQALLSFETGGIKYPRDDIEIIAVPNISDCVIGFTSAKELLDMTASANLEEAMLAKIYLAREGVSRTMLAHTCDLLPDGYTITFNAKQGDGDWALSGPNGTEVKSSEGLSRAVEEIKSYLSNNEPHQEKEKPLMTFFKNERIFEGYLEDSLNPAESKTVCMRVDGTDKIVSVDRASVLPYTQQELDRKYRNASKAYRGSLSGFVEYLESEAMVHADQLNTADQGIYTYFAHRARADAERAEAIINLSSRDVKISRYGPDLLLEELAKPNDSQNQAPTRYSSLDRIETYLIETKKASVRNDFEGELKKTTRQLHSEEPKSSFRSSPNHR